MIKLSTLFVAALSRWRTSTGYFSRAQEARGIGQMDLMMFEFCDANEVSYFKAARLGQELD